MTQRMKRLARPAGTMIALAVGLVAATVGSGRADDEEHFDIFRLNVAGKLLQHWVEDLDNDGYQDIFVIHRKGVEPDETRWVSIFWQAPGGGFGSAPDQSWELDTKAAVLDIGDVAGDSTKEICYITGDGVYYYSKDNGSYGAESRLLLSAKGLAVYPSQRTIPLIDFVRDWGGRGQDAVALSTFEGLTIYHRDSTGAFSEENKVLIELETSISRTRSRSRTRANDVAGISAHYSFPSLKMLDYNNDGLKDMIATTDDRVVVYVQTEDGNYRTEFDDNVLFDVLTQQEKLESLSDVQTLVEDLNNDGYADAVVTKQTAKGLTNFRSVVNVFYGSAAGFSSEPDQVIISEGTASAEAVFLDVNGDGRKDLVLPSVQFSIAAIIRILVTRSIKVYFNVFLLNEDNKLSERPDFTKEVKFKIDLSGESDDQAMDLEGDYNGDKRTDFVFATSKDDLSIYLGEPGAADQLFSNKPVAKIKANAFGELSSPDLNNDGFSDMILYYPTNKERKGTLEVLINRGAW